MQILETDRNSCPCEQAVRSSICIDQYPQRDWHSVSDSERHDIRLQVLDIVTPVCVRFEAVGAGKCVLQ
jgi:hypothetical protein